MRKTGGVSVHWPKKEQPQTPYEPKSMVSTTKDDESLYLTLKDLKGPLLPMYEGSKGLGDLGDMCIA